MHSFALGAGWPRQWRSAALPRPAKRELPAARSIGSPLRGEGGECTGVPARVKQNFLAELSGCLDGLLELAVGIDLGGLEVPMPEHGTCYLDAEPLLDFTGP